MDEAKLELVRDWLTRASHDLGAARALSSLEHPLLDVAIYHCQQAAVRVGLPVSGRLGRADAFT